MGQVWQATDTQLNRQVALKILPDAFAEDGDRLARFQREAQVLASLNHANIAAIHGSEKSEDTQALLERCLTNDVARRFRDIGDVAFELDRVLADAAGPTPAPADQGEGATQGLTSSRGALTWTAAGIGDDAHAPEWIRVTKCRQAEASERSGDASVSKSAAAAHSGAAACLLWPEGFPASPPRLFPDTALQTLKGGQGISRFSRAVSVHVRGL